MAKRISRAAARKIKDKWRAKEWYKVIAPDMFNKIQISETLADDPSKLIGRVAEVTMQDLTGDFSKMHIKLQFKIHDTSGYEAHTQFIGHNLTSDYVRRQTRRKRSKMDGVFDVRTKDNFRIRVKPMATTDKRIKTSQQQILRAIMGKVIEESAGNKTIGEFVKEMISGELSTAIYKACKPIYPIRRVEIRKSQILEMGELGEEIETEEKVEEGSETTEGVEVEKDSKVTEDVGDAKSD